MHKHRSKLTPAVVFLLSSVFAIIVLFFVIFVALTVQKNRIEESSADFHIALDCKEGDGGQFIYNGTKYVRLWDDEKLSDWIPKNTDTTKGIKTETITAYGLEDDINSYVFEVQVLFFDNYYCYSEKMIFPTEEELPDSIIAYCGEKEIRIEDDFVIDALINEPEKTEELLKTFFPENFNQNELSLYADWNDFPLMKCLKEANQ